MRSVLILGSGPIVIGQAAEFDYSGTQACLACREVGIRTILINSNPATIGTDPHIADTVYIEPLTPESVEAIIAIERPDGCIATVGGQTALNLAVALDDRGVFERYGVQVLGTGLQSIRRGEDRALFAETLRQAGQPVLPSQAVTTIEDAIQVARRIGYPVMCRSAFALGGAGSGFATNEEELVRQVDAGLRSSGSGQVLVEKSVYGWTEVEYEVVRDSAGNCLVVCNMENIDPMGVHTGDSIVVAPSQTLTDGEYHMLRRAAIDVVDALGVEGACNVQFALDRRTDGYPLGADSDNGEESVYYVIEVNPRLSRSSALASKATGYPIAKVATRIALGKTLPELRNDITGTSAFFEPALDYVVVKIPRWPYDKFHHLMPTIGTSMRSTGEVMAIGRTFQEALQKALRSVDTRERMHSGTLEDTLRLPNSRRLGAVIAALREGWEPAEIARLSHIHPWFVDCLAEIETMPEGNHVYKMVDTCAAEFEARTPYFYGASLPGGVNEAQPLPGPKAIILGSGPIRIGQGIEFDYATVHACHTLSEAGVQSIIVNNNPETVSTDYSTSDRLYFEPLDIEAVAAIVANECGADITADGVVAAPRGYPADGALIAAGRADGSLVAAGRADGLLGVIPQFGGQTAINLVGPLQERGIRILGTSPESIDAAEDRGKASAVLGAQGIPTPAWRSVDHWDALPAAVTDVGFPALLRPSYVLSGQGMILVRSDEDVQRYLDTHAHTPLTRPLLVDHFLDGAVELNVDAVSDGRDVVTVIMEQFEECGVHSGDSAEVYPVQRVSGDILETVEVYTQIIARAFAIRGLLNVQFAVQDRDVYVLEVNPRASRSIPFASKSSGIPLADLAIRVILGQPLADLHAPAPRTDRICVKEVVLPFRVFPELVPVLGPEMQSTGESMGMGHTFAEAYWKAELGAGMKSLPFGRQVYVSVGGMQAEAQAHLLALLKHAGCVPITSPESDVTVSDFGMAIVLGRREEDLTLLRRCVDAGVPYISTPGGLRALCMALEEGQVILEPMCAVRAEVKTAPGQAA